MTTETIAELRRLSSDAARSSKASAWDKYAAALMSNDDDLLDAAEENVRLKDELEETKTIVESIRNAHATLSRGIKKALNLENWPDFMALYGKGGPFAECVARLLSESMSEKDAENAKLRELNLQRELGVLESPLYAGKVAECEMLRGLLRRWLEVAIEWPVGFPVYVETMEAIK